MCTQRYSSMDQETFTLHEIALFMLQEKLCCFSPLSSPSLLLFIDKVKESDNHNSERTPFKHARRRINFPPRVSIFPKKKESIDQIHWRHASNRSKRMQCALLYRVVSARIDCIIARVQQRMCACLCVLRLKRKGYPSRCPPASVFFLLLLLLSSIML